MKIFLNYQSTDKEFALYFTDWMHTTFSNLKIFSTSHPMAIEPGRPWFNEIVSAATSVDMIFLLIGPDSLDYRWTLFEAGLAAADEKRKVVPIVFGGVRVDDVKLPLSFYQILRLDDRTQFNAFFMNCDFTPKNTISDFFNSFIAAGPFKDLYVKYGSYSRFYQDRVSELSAIVMERYECELTNIGSEIAELNREKKDKHEIFRYPLEKTIESQTKVLMSVRLSLMPIRCEGEVTWKAGITIDRDEVPFGGIDHIFQLHSGSHRGLSSWSLYWKEGIIDYPSINIPATLDFEAMHYINIWFNRDKNELLSYGIDSDRNRYVFTINGRERIWNPNLTNAKFLKIGGWIDNPTNQRFRVKAVYELDYC